MVIARALYSKPSVLLLDESTSALDQQTEKQVLNNLKNNSEIDLIIMVAHRQSALEFADHVIELA